MDVLDPDQDSQFGDGEGEGGNPETTVQYEQATSVLSRWSQSRRANSISTSNLPITYEADASASEEPGEPSPSLTAQERDEVLTELFTDVNGVSMDLEESPDERNSLSAPSTHFLPILRRTTTTETTVSRWTVSHIEGMTMKLNRLVELIRLHRSLQRIEIVSSEGYKQRTNGILHRFLVLALRRKDKPPVWLRMDRRTDPNISRAGFLLASGQTPANDTGIFSADKNDLIKEAQYESRQQFDTLTTLDDLRHLLQVMCEELIVYQANCWFFVSLLQQHLQGDKTGYFVDGSIKWGETAQAVRSRVDERLRLIYHIPLPLTIENILLSLQGRSELDTTVQGLVKKALVCAGSNAALFTGIHALLISYMPPKRQSQWISRDNLETVTASFSSGTESAQLLKTIAYHLYRSSFNLEALDIQQQTVKIARELYRRNRSNRGQRVPDAQSPRALFQRVQTDPDLHRTNFASYLNHLGVYLHNAQRYGDACATHQEAVMLARDLFEIDPSSHRATLASYLRELGVCLHNAQRYSNACTTHQEAVMLARELFEANPGSHRATLASYLSDLGGSLREAQRDSDSCATHQEAVMLARELFEANPGSYRVTLAHYLKEFGNSLHAAQRYSDACATHQEVVMLARELFEADPGSYRATLASYLYSLGGSLYHAEHYSDACTTHQEAVILARELFEADPGSHRATLTSYLNSLGVSLRWAERYSDACATHQEAVMLTRELSEADPGSHRATLALYLYLLGLSLHRAKQYSDAADTIQEAVQYQRQLFNDAQALQRKDLLQYLNFYVQVLEDQGSWAEIPVIRAEISRVELS